MAGTSGALHYHEITKHTPASVRYGSRRLDWASKPSPFKQYLELSPIPLPPPAAGTGFPATLAVAGSLGEQRELDAPELARLLTLSAGVNKVLRQPPADPILFRTYACAGALYPNEVYVACGGIEGLAAGLYHYGPAENALRLIRPGDPRPHLARATGAYPPVGEAPVSIILSGIPWRTTWKYKQRGYRHLFWDAGMILANLLALSASGGHPSEVVLGFEDAELNLLLGVDGEKEMALCIVAVGTGPGGPAAADHPPEPIEHCVAPISHWERSYDEIVQVHRDTGLAGFAEASLWHRAPAAQGRRPDTLSLEGIEKVIRKRGSKRSFKPAGVSMEELAGVLDHATHMLSCDWGEALVQPAVLAYNIEGLPAGAYAYIYGFDPIARGDFREQGRRLCLEQPLGGDGAATVFLMSDLDHATRTLGPRGYRAAQLEAGLVAGRIYLGAYACGFGATGLTFFDDEVRAFLQTEAEPMIAVAVGH